MQAIEFETQLENGIIQLPMFYQHWQEGSQVKVIVLVQDAVNQQQHKTASINRHAGKITLTEDPLDFQNHLRDEWV